MTEDKTLEIVERLARIEAILQTNTELLNDKASKSDVKALEDKVNKLENFNTWLSRTVGGLIIGAMMGLVLIGSKM